MDEPEPGTSQHEGGVHTSIWQPRNGPPFPMLRLALTLPSSRGRGETVLCAAVLAPVRILLSPLP